jgi:hypothetical protein
MIKKLQILSIILLLTLVANVIALVSSPVVDANFLLDKAEFISLINKDAYKAINRDYQHASQSRSTDPAVISAKEKLYKILDLTGTIESQFDSLHLDINDASASSKRMTKINSLLLKLNKISPAYSQTNLEVLQYRITSSRAELRKLEAVSNEYKATGTILMSMDTLMRITDY